MDTPPIVINLSEIDKCRSHWVGSKAAVVSQLKKNGFPVPSGFCLSVAAYDLFIKSNRLDELIAAEIGRKPIEDMRWEELWDSALRMRLIFNRSPFPDDVTDAVHEALTPHLNGNQWAIRSSAPGEDSKHGSFAGLHETVLGVTSIEEAMSAIKTVWASLWSDAALLYRKELGLDPQASKMAILIQQMHHEDFSGVAFSEDPRGRYISCAIIEAVRGGCAKLVGGEVDPERWVLSKKDGKIISHHESAEQTSESSLSLKDHDLTHLLSVLMKLEGLMGCPQDLEWTGQSNSFTILQSRPITTLEEKPHDKRLWYLSLTPGDERLEKLAQQVIEVSIPRLKEEGERFAAENLQDLNNCELAETLANRAQADIFWKKIYIDEFIPFAHGVRRFGVFYNDHINPDDPFEFLDLLKGESMIAFKRNSHLLTMAEKVKNSNILQDIIHKIVSQKTEQCLYESLLLKTPGGPEFLSDFEAFVKQYMDVLYAGESLAKNPLSILKTILEYSQIEYSKNNTSPKKDLENLFFEKLNVEDRLNGEKLLELARQSWKLRDDDNLLIGRIESQLFRAIEEGLKRLGIHPMPKGQVEEPKKIVEYIVSSLSLPDYQRKPPSFSWSQKTEESPSIKKMTGRQLIGQPAAAGLAKGSARIIRSVQDICDFRAGEVLICDAIQPTMTQLVPLASAIVERRGGMLIHGAIIARELGLPCVNGVSGIMSHVKNGDHVSVDGYLGIVIIGQAEFDLEWSS